MSWFQHYFTQQSIDPSAYIKISGKIDQTLYTLFSAKWLFSANTFDFGTRILLKHCKKTVKPQERILDLWCWYGIIAYCLIDTHTTRYKKDSYPDTSLHLDACDSSPLAVEVTVANLKSYRDHGAVAGTTIVSDILSDPYFSHQTYSMIVTNPPFSAGKKIVQGCIKQSYDHLEVGWVLRVVVPTYKWAKSYISYTQEVFWIESVEVVTLEAGYRVWKATK